MSNTREALRADIEAAIERLKQGAPTHKDLVAQFLKGTLAINPSTVALESARSRTHFGHKNCTFPDLRLRILEAKTGTGRVDSYKLIIEALRERVATLEQENKVKDSALAALLLEASRSRRNAATDGGESVTDFRARRDQKKSHRERT